MNERWYKPGESVHVHLIGNRRGEYMGTAILKSIIQDFGNTAVWTVRFDYLTSQGKIFFSSQEYLNGLNISLPSRTDLANVDLYLIGEECFTKRTFSNMVREALTRAGKDVQ